MPAKWPANDLRVLMVAPTARDRQASVRLFASAGISCTPCEDLGQLCGEIQQGAAAVIVPEETILTDANDSLAGVIQSQPVWSDLPVIVLSHAGAESPAVAKAMATLGNINLIERPVRISTL